MNKATCKVVLKWKENEEEKELNISSQTRKEKDIFVTGEKRFVPLEFSATEKDKNIPVTINGEQSIRISATKEIYPTIIILEEGKRWKN